jgi:hypothetical protein
VSKGHDEDAERLGRAAMRNKSQALEGEGKCVLAASQALQRAYLLEEHNHSLFTYYLLDGLRGANGESVDQNGNVTPDSFGRYVYDKVTEFSPDQRPIRKVEASGDIILAHYPRFATRSIDKYVHTQDIASIIKKGKQTVKVVQRWDGQRPTIQYLLRDFRRWFIGEKLEHSKYIKMARAQTLDSTATIWWIKKLTNSII